MVLQRDVLRGSAIERLVRGTSQHTFHCVTVPHLLREHYLSPLTIFAQEAMCKASLQPMTSLLLLHIGFESENLWYRVNLFFENGVTFVRTSSHPCIKACFCERFLET